VSRGRSRKFIPLEKMVDGITHSAWYLRSLEIDMDPQALACGSVSEEVNMLV
jgi:hypothetical protein